MTLVKEKPFQPELLEEERKKIKDKFTVRLNFEERARLDDDKKILQQPKDSTAIKTLAEIGSIVIHDKKMNLILSTILKNSYNNKRSGLVEFD